MNDKNKTQRQLLEEALRKKFSTVFNSARKRTVFLSLKGDYFHVNPALQELIGYSEKELPKKRIQEITCSEEKKSDRYSLHQV